MKTENDASQSSSSSRWIEDMYDDLHRMASSYMHNEKNTVSLSPTVLIHELYLRLPGEKHEELSRTHFFALASRTMRRALVDQARSETAKNGAANWHEGS